MKEAKHTPGPWEDLPEEADKPYIRIRGTTLGRRYKVANVLHAIYDNPPTFEIEETRANARLISAAPDLLAALKLCAAVCAGESMSKSELIAALEAARAAISKATEDQQ